MMDLTVRSTSLERELVWSELVLVVLVDAAVLSDVGVCAVVADGYVVVEVSILTVVDAGAVKWQYSSKMETASA